MRIRIESSFKSKDKDQKLTKTFNWEIDGQLYEIDLDTIEDKITITTDYESEYVTSQWISKLIQLQREDYLNSRKLKEGDRVESTFWKFLFDNENFYEEFNKIYLEVNDVLIDFLSLLRFHLKRMVFAKPKTEYSNILYYDEDKQKWLKIVLDPRMEATIGVYPEKNLNHSFLNNFDRLIKQGEKSLVAFRYLEIVSNPINTKAKWILVTTALEIAIKEVFISIDPKLEKLLTEINAPPLHKMYKSILKSISGYESPYYKDIQYGVEIRNKIIHRPANINIKNQDAINYLHMANCAIDHLLQVANSLKTKTPLNYKYKNHNEVEYKRYLDR